MTSRPIRLVQTPMVTSPATYSEIFSGVANTFRKLRVQTSSKKAWVTPCITLVFGLSIFAYGLAIIPFMMVLFLTGIALGVASSAIVLRLGPASEWFIWPIPSLISPFVGVFYPLSVLPAWMQAVARGLPPSYVFEGMRAVVEGRGVQPAQLLWGGGLALVYLALAGAFFASIYGYAIRTGLIARYSAESVT